MSRSAASGELLPNNPDETKLSKLSTSGFVVEIVILTVFSTFFGLAITIQ
jgi:hypothetical protein